MKNPFAKPVGNSDLIWDGDIRPEGIATTYKRQLSDGVTLQAAAGGFWVEERSSDVDSSLWGGQLALKANIPCVEKGYAKVGGSYLNYGNIEAQGPFDATGGGNSLGNTVDGMGAYAEDFDLIEGFVEICIS